VAASHGDGVVATIEENKEMSVLAAQNLNRIASRRSMRMSSRLIAWSVSLMLGVRLSCFGHFTRFRVKTQMVKATRARARAVPASSPGPLASGELAIHSITM
jgi:hypothetical protein